MTGRPSEADAPNPAMALLIDISNPRRRVVDLRR